MTKTHELLGRRGFLKAGGLVAAGVAAGGATAFGVMRRHPRMADLKKEHFAPHVGDTFTIEAEGVGRISAELVEVEGKRQGPVESFSLVFSAPRQPQLPQGMRTVSHPTVGGHDMFLVPIGADDTTVSYEAIFTRMVK